MTGIMNQLSLFETIKDKKVDNIIRQIKEKIGENKIDKIYEKEFAHKCCTFLEIREKLITCKEFEEYIKKLFNEASKYIEVVEDAYSEYLQKRKDIVISFSDRYCISLATKKYVGPIYTLEMLKNRLMEAKDEI